MEIISYTVVRIFLTASLADSDRKAQAALSGVSTAAGVAGDHMLDEPTTKGTALSVPCHVLLPQP